MTKAEKNPCRYVLLEKMRAAGYTESETEREREDSRDGLNASRYYRGNLARETRSGNSVWRVLSGCSCRGRLSGRWSFRGCVPYRKTLSEIYGEIIRDGVSESNRPLFSAPSIMLISIAARLMEEGGVPFCYILASPSPDAGDLTFLPHSADRA